MGPCETTMGQEVMQPQSLTATSELHHIIGQLEDRLSPVLRPSNTLKEVGKAEQEKSELMQELGYLKNRLNYLLERLHV